MKLILYPIPVIGALYYAINVRNKYVKSINPLFIGFALYHGAWLTILLK